MRSRAGAARAARAWINAVDREQMGRGMLLPPAHEVQRPGGTWEGTKQINPGSEEVEESEVEEEGEEEEMLCPGSRSHAASGTGGEDPAPEDVEPLWVTSVASFGIFSLWAFCPQRWAETCPARCTSAGVAGGADSALGTPQILCLPSPGPETPRSAPTEQLCRLIRLMTVLRYGKAAKEFAPALGGAFPGTAAAWQIWGREGDREQGRGSREKGKQQRSANPWKGGQLGHRAARGRC